MAGAWFVGQVPSAGHLRGNHTLMFPSLPLSKSKQIKSFKNNNKRIWGSGEDVEGKKSGNEKDVKESIHQY